MSARGETGRTYRDPGADRTMFRSRAKWRCILPATSPSVANADGWCYAGRPGNFDTYPAYFTLYQRSCESVPRLNTRIPLKSSATNTILYAVGFRAIANSRVPFRSMPSISAWVWINTRSPSGEIAIGFPSTLGRSFNEGAIPREHLQLHLQRLLRFLLVLVDIDPRDDLVTRWRDHSGGIFRELTPELLPRFVQRPYLPDVGRVGIPLPSDEGAQVARRVHADCPWRRAESASPHYRTIRAHHATASASPYYRAIRAQYATASGTDQEVAVIAGE